MFQMSIFWGPKFFFMNNHQFDLVKNKSLLLLIFLLVLAFIIQLPYFLSSLEHIQTCLILCVCVCICPLKYLVQLYVSCGDSQLSSTQKLYRWLLSWDSAFSGTYCQCLSILFLISPLSINHYPFLLDKYCISFIQDESHRYQTPWLASCLPSILGASPSLYSSQSDEMPIKNA